MSIQRLTSLTSRIMVFAVFSLSLTACPGQGTDQIHGMVQVNFSSTAVCQSQVRDVLFRNISGEEIVIRGATIAGGSDPEGNFKLLSVRVGDETTQASANILNEIRVPADLSYSFQVSYVPRLENVSNTAVLDIVYQAPREGVIQVALAGTSSSRAPNCQTGGGSVTNGVGDLKGELTITVNRIGLATPALQAPIATDISPKHPFAPVDLPVVFGADDDSILLRQIPASLEFNLPPTLLAPLSLAIFSDTLVTSNADASGVYADDGSITLENVPIHLADGRFASDFVVTLTTGALARPNVLNKSLLESGGFTLSEDGSQVLGSAIDPDTLDLRLVGVGTFTNASGTGTVADNLKGGGVFGAVVIEATVNAP